MIKARDVGGLSRQGIVYIPLTKGKFTAIYYFNNPYAGSTYMGDDMFFKHNIIPTYLIKNHESGLNLNKYFFATYDEIVESLND